MYDVRVKALLDRSIEVDWPYLWMEGAYMTFPAQRRTNRAPTFDRKAQWRNQAAYQRRRPLPNDGVITRLFGAMLLEQNNEWAVQRSRYMTFESVSGLNDNAIITLPAMAA